MDDYRLSVNREVMRLIRTLIGSEIAVELTSAINQLSSEPEPAVAEGNPEAADSYRLLVGEFEIHYTMDKSERLIHVRALLRRAPDA